MTTAAVFVVLILFCEVGIVCNIYAYNLIGFDVPINNLSNESLNKFGVVRDSAEEYFFKVLAGLDNGEKQSFRCQSFDDSEQVFNAPRDRKEQNACDQFTVQNTRDFTLEYDSVWYFGSGVPEKQQSDINRVISRLVTKNIISGKLKEDATDSPVASNRYRLVFTFYYPLCF